MAAEQRQADSESCKSAKMEANIVVRVVNYKADAKRGERTRVEQKNVLKRGEKN